MSAGRPVFFGGISVYLQQHSRSSGTRRGSSTSCGTRRRDQAVRDRIDPGGSAHARRRSRSRRCVAKAATSGRKSRSSWTGWPASRRRLVNLPNSMLIALAAPIRRVLDRPVVVTLQGDDLFLDGLTEPYQIGVDRVDSAADSGRRSLRLGERVLHRLHVPLSAHPAGPHTHGAAWHQRGRLSRARSARAGRRDVFTIGYFARIAPEKGLHNLVEAYRILRPERGCRPRACARPATWPPINRPTSKGSRDRGIRGWPASSTISARSIATRKARFLSSIDVLSVPSGYHEPKGLYLLEAMAVGVPAVQPNHGAFPEMLGRTGGGLLVEPNDPERAGGRHPFPVPRPEPRARTGTARCGRGEAALRSGAHGGADMEIYGGVTLDATADRGEAERRAAQ